MLWQRKSGELAAEYGLRQVAAWTVGSLDDAPCVIYQAAPGTDVRPGSRRLAADPRVAVAQPVQRFRVLAPPPSQAPPSQAAPSQAPPSQATNKSGYNDPYADLQRDARSVSLGGAPRRHRQGSAGRRRRHRARRRPSGPARPGRRRRQLRRARRAQLHQRRARHRGRRQSSPPPPTTRWGSSAWRPRR